MPRRIAVALLAPPTWSPPGVDRTAWRLALVEDVLDVLATMVEVEAAVAVVAADAGALSQVGWPGLRSFVVPALDVATVFAAVGAEGYDQAALVAGDAPDLPGMLIAKLLRPLTTRPVAAAPAVGGPESTGDGPAGGVGLLGLSAVLPAPSWLPGLGLDDLTPQSLRRLAPRITDVAPAAGWHRLRSPADLSRLDPRLEGWDATRSLLTTPTR